MMTSREVVRRLKKLGAVNVRSNKHPVFRATKGKLVVTVPVPMHPGDVAKGTLYEIQRQFEPIFGKGWLLS